MEATSGTPAPFPGSGAVEADGIRVIPEAVRAAAREAPGHWIGVVDPEWTEERTPPEWAVLGEWRSDDDGDVGTYRANPAYRPSARALGWPEPTDPVDAAAQRAATGYGPVEEAVAALAAAEVTVVAGPDGIPLVAAGQDGESVVLVFTSPAHAFMSPTLRHDTLPVRDLIRSLAHPSAISLLVNAGAVAPSSFRRTASRWTAARIQQAPRPTPPGGTRDTSDATAPASPAARTESGPHGERTSSTGPRTSTSADERTESAVAAGSAAGTGTHVAAEPSSGPGSGGGAEPAPAAKPDSEAAPASEAEALEEKAEAAAPATASGARTATDTDVGGASVATSRLPMLVRTITATAIDKPDDAVKPVGRPGRAVLAGAAIGGSLLVAVPFLLLGADDDKEERASTTAATVLGGDKENETGDFAVSSPEPHDSADKKETQKPKAVPGSTPDAESGKNDGPDKAAEDAAKRAEAQKKAEAEKARERAAAAENSSNDTSGKAEGNAPAGRLSASPCRFTATSPASASTYPAATSPTGRHCGCGPATTPTRRSSSSPPTALSARRDSAWTWRAPTSPRAPPSSSHAAPASPRSNSRSTRPTTS